MLVRADAPFAGAESAGFPADYDCFTMLTAMNKRDQDLLKFDYVAADGKTYRVPDGPTPFPHPKMAGERGLATLKQICKTFGSRPQTLLHGDGHPGNLFQKKSTKAFTWIDFQG